ncbi:uncharacterized protein LOC132616002 [Lycium barbarum]|uniref:uncharacterized protein LOC132616002 n=1 Tax=Lycium barbarum TaxID=112863 RepID=UPI00293E0E58|nr:uncharacterized protein LOC132616002 [Lycium barbarum]
MAQNKKQVEANQRLSGTNASLRSKVEKSWLRYSNIDARMQALRKQFSLEKAHAMYRGRRIALEEALDGIVDINAYIAAALTVEETAAKTLLVQPPIDDRAPSSEGEGLSLEEGGEEEVPGGAEEQVPANGEENRPQKAIVEEIPSGTAAIPPEYRGHDAPPMVDGFGPPISIADS